MRRGALRSFVVPFQCPAFALRMSLRSQGDTACPGRDCARAPVQRQISRVYNTSSDTPPPPEPWYRGFEANRGLVEASSRPHRGLIEASSRPTSRPGRGCIEAGKRASRLTLCVACIEASRQHRGWCRGIVSRRASRLALGVVSRLASRLVLWIVSRPHRGYSTLQLGG